MQIGVPKETAEGERRVALAYLTSLIAPDGHIRYSRSLDQTPVWVTAEAVMALAQKPLPIAPAPLPAAAGRPVSKPAVVPARNRAKPRRATPSRQAAVARRVPVLSDALVTYTGVAAALALAPIGIS